MKDMNEEEFPPKWVSSSQGLEYFASLGTIIRASQVFDVVFVHSKGQMLHYQGHFMGWMLFKAEEMTEEQAREHVKQWFKEATK